MKDFDERLKMHIDGCWMCKFSENPRLDFVRLVTEPSRRLARLARVRRKRRALREFAMHGRCE